MQARGGRAGASADDATPVLLRQREPERRQAVEEPAAFELLVVTEDGDATRCPGPAAQMAPLLALTQAQGVVLLWDPDGPTLIAANLLGEWIDPGWSAHGPRDPEGRG